VDRPADLAKPLPQPFTRLGVYHDVAVLAFPEFSDAASHAGVVTSSGALPGYCDEENWPAVHACDGDPETFWRTSRTPTLASPVWIQAAYSQPLAATAVFLQGMPDGGRGSATCRRREDGQTFRSVARFTMGKGEAKVVPIPETRSTCFRLVIPSAYAPDVSLAEFQVLRQSDKPVVRRGSSGGSQVSQPGWWYVNGSLGR